MEKPIVLAVNDDKNIRSHLEWALRLKDKGFPAYLTEITLGGKTWHRVRVGFYSMRNDALEIGKKIASEFKIKDSWAVQPTKEERRIYGKNL